mmetsp:Transcript_4465/g.16876  ORF Transcript_4465/g.16876 Transcript_4465/m.16876 type:complete len:82 (+) Transcript_4465:1389-1634(+)
MVFCEGLAGMPRLKLDLVSLIGGCLFGQLMHIESTSACTVILARFHHLSVTHFSPRLYFSQVANGSNNLSLTFHGFSGPEK